MKKYIYFFATALLAAFTSCSNDEIEIANAISVKVDPSGVISPFTFELDAGELESFPTSYRLRTRTLAYNEKGLLTAADTTFLTNYKSRVDIELYLPKGEYTLLTITDVVRREDNETTFEYWKLTDDQDLNLAKISDTGYIGHQMSILGIASRHASVVSGTESYTMNPTPAGALLLIYNANIHQYSILEQIDLEMNRACDFISFNSYGEYVATPENHNNQFDWRCSTLEPADFPNSDNIYDYAFLFPMDNVKFKFAGYSSTDGYNLSDEMLTSLNPGDEYLFMLDLNDNGSITTNWGLLNGTSSSKPSLAPSVVKAKAPSAPVRKSMFSSKVHNTSYARISDLIRK